jgi:hypothetical protein
MAGAGGAGTGASAGKGGEAGAGGASVVPACPDAYRLALPTICVWFDTLVTDTPDQCCYLLRDGHCCGRPILIEEKAVVAPLTRGPGWAV